MPDSAIALNAALVAALNDMPAVTRDRDVDMGTFSYKFADLATVMAQVKPVLKAHGLAFMQNVVALEGGKIGVCTVIVHEQGGERWFGPLPMSAGGNAQALGSGITYAKRYSLMAALGIATEDDDGQAHKEAPQAVPELKNSAAAAALFDRVTYALQDPELKKHLVTFGKENGRKPYTADGFDADPRWAKQVAGLLDGWDKADRLDAQRAANEEPF